MKNKVLIAIFTTLAILIIFYRPSNSTCEKRIKNTIVYGKVIGKYLDKEEHQYPTLIFSNKIDGNQKLYIYNDESGFYDYVQLRDSVCKDSNDMKIRIFRNNILDTTFILKIICL